MILRRTAKVGIDSTLQFGGGGEAVSLDYRLFAMDPLGFDRIEPRTLGWQQASENADAFPALLDLLVVRVQPDAD